MVIMADGHADDLHHNFLRNIQSRIVALIDMDCFYVQVEQRLAPEWKGKPCAVVQYNEWKGGGIIAVGYEARASGVTRRGMRGEDAQKVCPEIKLFKVPEVRGKADLTRYREAGAEVITVLSQFEGCKVERASVDEAYIDLTDKIQEMMSLSTVPTADDLPHTYIIGCNEDDRESSLTDWLNSVISSESLDSYNDLRLALGAVVVERMRKAVKDQTGFNCSAGISHNKVLSKLACGLHKPQKQTILGINAVPDLFATFPVGKVRHFGGKLGQSVMDDFNVQYIGELVRVPKQELCTQYGTKTGNFIYEMCRGHDPEPVNSRQLPKSVGCSKNFRGKLVITKLEKARYWLQQLTAELVERLNKDKQQNNRIAKSLSMSVRFADYQCPSRALPLTKYSLQTIESSAMTALTKLCGAEGTTIEPAITCLSLCAGKFEDIESKSLTNYFQSGCKSTADIFDNITPPSKPSKPVAAESATYSLKSFLSGTNNAVDPFSSVTTHRQQKPKGIAKYFVASERKSSQSEIVKEELSSPGAPFDNILYGPDTTSLKDDILGLDLDYSSDSADSVSIDIVRESLTKGNNLICGDSQSNTDRLPNIESGRYLDELISAWDCDSSDDAPSNTALGDQVAQNNLVLSTHHETPDGGVSFYETIKMEEEMHRRQTTQEKRSLASSTLYTTPHPSKESKSDDSCLQEKITSTSSVPLLPASKQGEDGDDDISVVWQSEKCSSNTPTRSSATASISHKLGSKFKSFPSQPSIKMSVRGHPSSNTPPNKKFKSIIDYFK